MTNTANSLVYVNVRTGDIRRVAGGIEEAVIAGADSAAFGRTWQDEMILYITTTGGIAYPPTIGIVGAKLVALDTSKLDLI